MTEGELFDNRIGEGASARQTHFPSPLAGEGGIANATHSRTIGKNGQREALAYVRSDSEHEPGEGSGLT